MKALLLLARAGRDLDNVRVIEYWQYRCGRLINPDNSDVGRIDTWNCKKNKNFRCNQSSTSLHHKVVEECKMLQPDNHVIGVVEYKGQVLTIRWSDGFTMVILGHCVESGEYGKGYTPKTPR